jgi:hypothetical protein
MDWPFKESYLPDKDNLPAGTDVQRGGKASALDIYAKIKTQAAVSSNELKRRKNPHFRKPLNEKITSAYSPTKK